MRAIVEELRRNEQRGTKSQERYHMRPLDGELASCERTCKIIELTQRASMVVSVDRLYLSGTEHRGRPQDCTCGRTDCSWSWRAIVDKSNLGMGNEPTRALTCKGWVHISWQKRYSVCLFPYASWAISDATCIRIWWPDDSAHIGHFSWNVTWSWQWCKSV